MATAVEGTTFVHSLTAPGSETLQALTGSGVRSIQTPTGETVHVTTVGVYVDPAIKTHLSTFKGKSEEELLDDKEFIIKFLQAPVEKAVLIKFLVPLTGEEYASKAGPGSKAVLEAAGKYGEEEEKGFDKFISIFKPLDFQPGGTLHFFYKTTGQVQITYAAGQEVPKVSSDDVIESPFFAGAFVATLIGSKTVSPNTRSSFVHGLAAIINA